MDSDRPQWPQGGAGNTTPPAIVERREAATVKNADADPGAGVCRDCWELIGNYHATDCPRVSAE